MPLVLRSQNSGIGYYEERSAGNAVKALMDSLAPKAKARRNGQWSEIDSADLVPGDIVAFKVSRYSSLNAFTFSTLLTFSFWLYIDW
jgi:magnesium-transporting ATPase (P-type)